MNHPRQPRTTGLRSGSIGPSASLLASLSSERICRCHAHSGLGRLFVLVDALLRRFVKATKVPQDRRDDVVQEAWADIGEHLHGFEEEHASQQLYCWMYRVIRTKAAIEIRYLIKHTAGSLDALTAATEPEDRRESASAVHKEKKRQSDLFRRWLEERGEKDSLNDRLLRGRYLDERSVVDLAVEEGRWPPSYAGASSAR
jgi:DNA-directed RNA polymerase specialized sigma24 family protein